MEKYSSFRCGLVYFIFAFWCIKKWQCTLTCQKQCLHSSGNILHLLHSKVNTRTTKIGYVIKFLLGREVVNLNSSKWRANKETYVVIDIQDLHHIQDTGGISVCDTQPRNVKCFSIESHTSGFLPKRNTLRAWKSCLLKGNPWKKRGKIEIKLCRILFKG